MAPAADAGRPDARAYYNEIDPYAAAWLRNLIVEELIAPGDVDERDIRDVRPDELRGYRQCHFFAGIGVWSHALRGAGWPDDRAVWTGSCPCQPFSTAGKRGGVDDERHLWPAFFHLVEALRPPVVLGEQVASKDGLAWLDLVQADLEGAGYAVGAADMCAAGIGAPHIRQRLWFSAVRLADTVRGRAEHDPRKGVGAQAAVDRSDGRVPRQRLRPGLEGAPRRMDDDDDAGLEGQRRRHKAESGRVGAVQPAAEASESGGLVDAECLRRDERFAGNARAAEGAGRECRNVDHRPSAPMSAGQTHGFWRAADWLGCRDGKWRPVEPGTFPLAHGAPARVGRLRAYGNAIVAPLAQEFVEAVQFATGADLA